MDPGLIKNLLEDDEEDESGPPVSGAAVDAYTERLKGVLGGGAGGTGAAAAAYGLGRAGNGSLKPIASPNPPQAPTQSSVPPATVNASTTSAAAPAQTPQGTPPGQITQSQWQKLTPQQQQLYRQQYMYRQQQQQQQQLQQQQRAQQQQQQQQAGPGLAAQQPRRQNNLSQGISFGALMPLLQPHLPPEQSEQLSALYQRFKQNEITREDFVRGARVIVGDQVLVQTIRQMHQKQQQQGATQPAGNQQQMGSSSQSSGTQVPGMSSQAPTHGGAQPNTQPSTTMHATEPQSAQAGAEQTPQSAVAVQAQSLQQQQQQQQRAQVSGQAGAGPVGSQQSKVETQPQGSSQSGPPKVGTLPQTAPLVGQNQSQGATDPSPPILQQVKNEVDKAVGPTQAGRPLQGAATIPFGTFQARPPVASPLHPVGGQVNSALAAQVPKAPTPMQFSSLGASAQVRPGGYSPAMSDSSQQSDQKAPSKYAKAKMRKEQKAKEQKEQETLRMKKIQEEERLRRLQQGGPVVANTQAQSSNQVAQSLSMPTMPQPHPKLLESKQQGVQTIPAVKQEPQADQHAGTALQRVPGAPPTQLGQLGIKAPGVAELPEAAGSQAPGTVSKDSNTAGVGGEKTQPTAAAASPMNRYPGLPGMPNPSHGAAGVGTPTGIPMPQAGGPIRQGPPYVLAMESRSPAMNFNTGATAITKDAAGPVLGIPSAPGAQPLGIGAKTPLKKPAVAVGQKKPGEAMPPAAQPASKKQKTQGTEADQSIDALNDVTAVSGVNLREEEEQLLAGPKEESRTTEAMRKFVQEEEERLFLERGPLRAKTQAIAAKAGLRNVSEDVERCLSMAAEERLRSMLYKLIKYSKQRCDVEKEAHNTYVNNDPRRQVLLMKRKAKEAMEKKQADENERLRKLNEKKDKGALTDGDNDDLKRRAQMAQQEEDDKMRAKAANVAARNAVGATDMLSKWQMMAAQGLAKRQGGDSASDSARAGTADETAGSREQERRQENGEAGKASGSGRMDADGDGPSGPAAAGRPPGPGPGTGRGTGVRRIGASQGGRLPRSVAMKDVIALLEREPQMSKSSFLYRLYERDRKGESSRRL